MRVFSSILLVRKIVLRRSTWIVQITNLLCSLWWWVLSFRTIDPYIRKRWDPPGQVRQKCFCQLDWAIWWVGFRLGVVVVGCVGKQISARCCDKRLDKHKKLKKSCFRNIQRKKSLQNMVVEALSLFLGNQHSCVLTTEMGVILYMGAVGRMGGVPWDKAGGRWEFMDLG